MKTKFNSLIIVLGIFFVMGFACQFTTANLSEITFSEDETGRKNFISAKQGERIYVLSSINNTKGKHIVRWKVTDSKGKEIKLPENEASIEGARKIWLTIALKPNVFPAGKYNFHVTLISQKGGEIETKTATLKVRN